MNIQKQKYVFISYSSNDKKFARRIVTALENSGIALWIDEQQLDGGDSLFSKIGSAIGGATYFIIILSEKSVSSKWVQVELKYAMTTQMRGTENFIVPLRIESCEIPWFLNDHLYIDFSNIRNFKSSALKLLKTLDENQKSKELNNEEFTRTAVELAVDKLQSNMDLQKTSWLEEFKNLPLVKECETAVRNGSYGGHFSQTLPTILVYTSNQRGNLSINNLVALLGFIADTKDEFIIKNDLRQIYRCLVENWALTTEYRWFILSSIVEAAPLIPERFERTNVLPCIFPESGVDPLANRLINDFFSANGSLFIKLWSCSSIHQRQGIIAYASRIGSWKEMPDFSSDTPLIENARTAFAHARKKWTGVSTFLPTEDIQSMLASIINNSAKSGTLSLIVEAVEKLSAVPEGLAIPIMANLSSEKLSSEIFELRGQRFFFNLYVQIISSPYVDSIISALCLLALIRTCGIESIKSHKNFPTCLLRRPEQGFCNTMSIIDSLVEQISIDENDAEAIAITLGILNIFNQAPLFAATSISIKSHKNSNASLKKILNFIHGKVSNEKIRLFSNDKVRTWKNPNRDKALGSESF